MRTSHAVLHQRIFTSSASPVPTVQAVLDPDEVRATLYVEWDSNLVLSNGNEFKERPAYFRLLVSADDSRFGRGPGDEWAIAYLGLTSDFPVPDDEDAEDEFLGVLMSEQPYMAMFARQVIVPGERTILVGDTLFEFLLSPVEMRGISGVAGVLVPQPYRDYEVLPPGEGAKPKVKPSRTGVIRAFAKLLAEGFEDLFGLFRGERK